MSMEILVAKSLVLNKMVAKMQSLESGFEHLSFLTIEHIKISFNTKDLKKFSVGN